MSALNGIRVIELAHENCAFTGKLLADMGADVVVIEPLEGAASRGYEPFVDDVPDVRRVGQDHLVMRLARGNHRETVLFP